MPMESPDLKNKEKKELQEVSSSKVTCDGGGGTLGHPKIYLDMGDETEITCPYCSKLFVLDKNN